jgi:hypothetical protein
LHDVISYILASDKVPRNKKRAEILLAAGRYRDNTSFVMSVDEWRQMAAHMGQQNMGGPAVAFLPAFPTPTVARGAVMAGMSHTSEAPTAANDHAEHESAAADSAVDGAAPHSMDRIEALHRRMLADPVIRERVANDPVLQKMLKDAGMTLDAASPEHEGHSVSPDTTASQAMHFITMLLSTPGIEQRIENDAELRQLWSDTGVQNCLQEMRRLKAEGKPLPAVCPVNAVPASSHKH